MTATASLAIELQLMALNLYKDGKCSYAHTILKILDVFGDSPSTYLEALTMYEAEKAKADSLALEADRQFLNNF